MAALFSTQLYAQELTEYITAKAARESISLCNEWDVNYKGNIRLDDAVESGDYLIVTGTVDYYSDNCYEVTAKFRMKLKQVLDDLQVSCFIMYMPNCIWGSQRRIDKEYTTGCCECR